MIETPLPNNDLEKTDSHIAGVSEGEYSGEKKPVEEPDHVSLQDRTYDDLKEEEPELVLPQEKPSSKVLGE